MMIEMLAAGLTGGSFTVEVDRQAPPDAHTFRTGQFYLFIDPTRGGNDRYAHRIAELAEVMRGAGMTRLPGDRRYANRARAEREGIPVTDLVRALFE
jgi:delta1-piperideine-2-carboxylate reductase